MNKTEFLQALAEKLDILPQKEIEITQAFYAEMIDDRIEDGMSETDAITAIGDLNTIVQNTLMEMPLPALMKARIQPKSRLKSWEIVLLILGFPVWFPVLAAFFAVILSVYASIWIIIVSLYVTVAALVISGLAGLLSLFLSPSLPAGLFFFGTALFFIGIGVLSFFGVTRLSGWLVTLTGKFIRFVKSQFIKKEVA